MSGENIRKDGTIVAFDDTRDCDGKLKIGKLLDANVDCILQGAAEEEERCCIFWTRMSALRTGPENRLLTMALLAE